MLDRFLKSTILGEATSQEEKLVELLLRVGEKSAIRVTAAALRVLRENFYRDAGLLITDHGTIRDLFPKTKQPIMMPFQPPADDHGRLVFCEGARPIAYLSQPYGLDHTSIKRIIAFSEGWGLEVDINPGQAMWYPGKTCAVAYSIPGATYGTPWETMPG